MPAGNSDGTALLEPRQIERGLRELGLSARQARRLLSGGYKAYAGNVDPDDADELLSAFIHFYQKFEGINHGK